jgi:hypothetical protein
LQVRAYSPATSRSDLHDNFEIDPSSVEASSVSSDHLEDSVPAGTSTSVTVGEKVADLSSLVGAPPGVYPVTVTLTAPDGLTALDSVTTQLLYFPEEVEVPLNVVLFWPLSDLPSRGADGTFFAQGDSGTVPLAKAVAERGWLDRLLDELEAPGNKDARISFVPGPRLIEELRDMADGYPLDQEGGPRSVPRDDPSAANARSVIGRVEQLLDSDRHQSVLAPYALPDLTSLADFEQMTAQITASENALRDLLDLEPGRGWIFPPGGRMDEVTLERLRSSDAAASTVMTNESLEVPDVGSACREDFTGTPYTCPVVISTEVGRTRGYVLDNDLQERFGSLVSSPGDVVENQRLLAELAMIWAELPGVSERVVALAVPPLWHPSRLMAGRFVKAIARGPWIRSRTARGGLHLGIGAIERDLVAESAPPRTRPDQDFFDRVDTASSVVESFARIQPPDDLVQRLRRDVLMAQSAMWWSDPERLDIGDSFAEDAQAEALAELNKISIGGRRNITLTSRRGPVPLVLRNGTEYPVSLEIHLESADRDLEISDRIVTQDFDPGATPIPVQASARSSGIYPVRVRIEASDGYDIYETSISIRSTEFNEIALAITLGAFLFLVSFSIVRGIRRRREPQEPTEA